VPEPWQLRAAAIAASAVAEEASAAEMEVGALDAFRRLSALVEKPPWQLQWNHLAPSVGSSGGSCCTDRSECTSRKHWHEWKVRRL